MVEPESFAPEAEYGRRLHDRQEQVRHHAQTDDRLSLARGLIFFPALALVAYSATSWSAGLTWSLLALGCGSFVVIVVLHTRVVQRRTAADRAARYYQLALDRLKHRWQGTGIPGSRYANPEHMYAGDLDLFGTGSVFERLCAARTRPGEDTLAAWLCHPADAETIRARQAAVAELNPQCDLREQLALLDAEVHDELDQNQLLHWARQSPQPVPAVQRVIAGVLGLAAVVALFSWLLFDTRPTILLFVLMLELLFLAMHRRQIQELAQQSDAAGSGLKILSRVMDLIESREFNTPLLQQLSSRLTTDHLPPSRQIQRLNTQIRWLNNCLHNQFFAGVACLLCLPIHVVAGIERWRENVGTHIPDWLTAVGEFESLVSLSMYSFEKPHDPFPEIVEPPPAANQGQSPGPLFEAVAAGHPLLPATECVRNDVSVGADLQLLLVSGSNMSGKSTLLRTIGTNSVLALAGGPVCATSLRISPLQLGTAMRVQDSLQAGTSLFYAVIRRLKSVVELTDGQLPLLFLLDELLQGTNSHDRRVGSEGVIRRLLASGAAGLVTTHDLALTEIVDEFGERARNIHFEDHLVDGKMSFDYRIRPGVVRKSNALELMRMLGLDV